MAEGADGVTGEFLTSIWDALGGDVAGEPLVDVDATPAVEERWLPTPDRPLAGIRVLDLTRVLAGPTATMGSRCSKPSIR